MCVPTANLETNKESMSNWEPSPSMLPVAGRRQWVSYIIRPLWTGGAEPGWRRRETAMVRTGTIAVGTVAVPLPLAVVAEGEGALGVFSCTQLPVEVLHSGMVASNDDMHSLLTSLAKVHPSPSSSSSLLL